MPRRSSKPVKSIDKDEIRSEYQKREGFYTSLEEEALFALKKRLGETKIKLHSVVSRVKEVESLIGKCERFKIEAPFEVVEDLVGLRVICLFLSDIEKIGALIRELFPIIREDNKIDNSKFASFGYLSVHFVAKLGDGYSGIRYENITDLAFEIQVRTIAMDAWANISHYLDYKTDEDIPSELKRDFYALSGMFYVADKHFQLFFEQREERREELADELTRAGRNHLAIPVNLDTLKAYLTQKLPDRSNGPAEFISATVDLLNRTGYQTLADVDMIFSEWCTLAQDYEKTAKTEYTNIGLLRQIFEMADPKFDLAQWEQYFESKAKAGENVQNPRAEAERTAKYTTNQYKEFKAKQRKPKRKSSAP